MSAADDSRHPAGVVPLAIVGIGCLFPKSGSLDRYWQNVKAGVDAITDIPETHWRPEDYSSPDPSAPDMTYARRGGFLEPVDFDTLEFGISPNNIEATDTTQLLGLMVAKRALEDAGYATGEEAAGGRPFDRDRTSVILGVTGTLELVIPLGARLGHPVWRRALRDAGVDDAVAEEVVQRIAEGYVPWQENSFPGLLGNVTAGRIANRFDLRGTNCVVDAACASSLSALHMAAMELHSGRADMVIGGGVDTFNDIFMYMCFSKTPALSPTGNSRPFSADGDGTILGEGMGILVLKRLADARRDGDRIRAVVRGLGSSSDGRGTAIFEPSPRGQIKALRSAYREADVSPATIELFEAHGTGTKVGDATELAALAEVFREADATGQWCALGSVKSMIGHTKAAAGVAGLIKVAMALEHKVLPPTIKVDRPLPPLANGASPVYLNLRKRPWVRSGGHPRRAALSAFGFGGSNFHCVVEEAAPGKAAPDWTGDAVLLAFSGESRSDLEARLGALPEGCPWDELRSRAVDLRREFDSTLPFRLAWVAERGGTGVARLREGAVERLATESSAAWSNPGGVYFGTGPLPGKLAVLFPGQGAQRVGMLGDLACQFPAMLDALEEGNAAFGPSVAGERLSDRIYPVPAFDEATRDLQSDRLQDTRVAQPAIGAVSLGAWRVLAGFSVAPDAFAGHSFGELVALCAAGRFDAGALHRLARRRGELMAECAGGGMLAVAAAPEAVADLVEAASLELAIANRNAPRQTVLSGPTGAIEQARRRLEAEGIATHPLPVSAAFHSPLVAAAEAPFAAALEEIPFAAGRVPVYANATGAPYPEDQESARRLLAGQLVRTVQFQTLVENLYAGGVHTFLEVGPGDTLRALTSAILEAKPHTALTLDASTGGASGERDLGRVLAQLAALGYRVDLPAWDAGWPAHSARRSGARPAVNVSLSGANTVRPRAPAPRRAARPPPRPEAAAPEAGPRAPAPATSRDSPPAASPPAALDGPTAGAGAALEATQQGILALQKIQAQTAELHRQYLEGQQAAQRSIHELLLQQQRLIGGVEVSADPGASPPAGDDGGDTRGAAAAPAPASPEFETAPPAAVADEPTPAATGTTGEIVLAVVAEKTGYPAEMLDLDMALDGDLGVDSIKRVEILAALEERLPHLAAPAPDQAGALETLRQVAAFLDQGEGEPEPAPEPAAPGPEAPVEDPHALVAAVVADKTGYPAEMLEPSMRLDADLGIDSIKRVEILSALKDAWPALPDLTPEAVGGLESLADVAACLDGSGPRVAAPPVAAEDPGPAAAPPAPVATGGAAAPLSRQALATRSLKDLGRREPMRLSDRGEFLITDDGSGLAERVRDGLAMHRVASRIIGLDAAAGDTELAGLLILAPPAADSRFIAGAFGLLQRLSPGLRRAGPGGRAVLAVASRLDGAFGLAGTGLSAPVSAGLTGLLKTAVREWPEVSGKALDLSGDFADLNDLAAEVVDELLLEGPLEVGIAASGRCTLALADAPWPEPAATAPIEPGATVVVSGGARGVTAEAALALARAYRPELVLLGRSPAPGAEPAWLAALGDEAEIKRGLAARGAASTPAALEAEYRRIAAAREISTNLERIRAAGATVHYRQADVRDAAAVREALASLPASCRPVQGLIHGAGVIADRRMEEKTAEQFAAVFSTKVDGLRSLLSALEGDRLRFLVLFSSSSGRFGREGQADYAAANEVLNKMAQAAARDRPGCRVVSINWGPWRGGMVTDPLARRFEEEEIELIDPEAGAAFCLRELATPAGGPVEIVARASSGRPAAAAPAVSSRPGVAAPDLPDLKVAFERRLSLETHSFLGSHVLNARAVLPAVVTMEWFAHGAIHDNPGLTFRGFDDLRIFHGVTLDRDASTRVRVLARAPRAEGGQQVVEVELRSGETRHASARIVLGTEPAVAEAGGMPIATVSHPGPGNVYGDGKLFHGPGLHGIRTIEGWSRQGIVAEVRAAPPPSAWMEHPIRSAWLADPLALDCAFQLVVLWCIEFGQGPSLPVRIGSYRQFRRGFPASGVRVACRITQAGDHSASADIDFLDADGELVARMEGYECVVDASLEAAFARNHLEPSTATAPAVAPVA